MTPSLSLFELNNLVRSTIEVNLDGTFWITAELSEVRTASNGHCYVEFIQKEERRQSIIAKARGVIWNNVYSLLKPYFEQVTGQRFEAGLSVLVEVSISFHELYGYSLSVSDIDPTYTMGDIARRRKEILAQLDSEGVATLNKELELPQLIKRIAIISSETAAGYGDFCNQIETNTGAFVFQTKLFPAVMQGEYVEKTIISALNDIAEEMDCWDVVVIIRGGGAVSDLNGFDTYDLANNVAQFPLPVFTGIGHERDETVLDFVANIRFKTPTAVAAFLIEHMNKQNDIINSLGDRIVKGIVNILSDQHLQLKQLEHRFTLSFSTIGESESNKLERINLRLKSASASLLQQQKHRIDIAEQNLSRGSHIMIERENNRLRMFEQQLKAADPRRILQRGYSLTLKDGKVVSKVSDLKSGDTLKTLFADGETESIVK